MAEAALVAALGTLAKLIGGENDRHARPIKKSWSNVFDPPNLGLSAVGLLSHG
jgi:hypothetical protein